MNKVFKPLSKEEMRIYEKRMKMISGIGFVRDVPPCPFCGQQPKLLTQKVNEYGIYKVVRCTNDNCLVRPSTKFYETPKEAKDAWSKRA